MKMADILERLAENSILLTPVSKDMTIESDVVSR